jgi:hypothetical protein
MHPQNAALFGQSSGGPLCAPPRFSLLDSPAAHCDSCIVPHQGGTATSTS